MSLTDLIYLSQKSLRSNILRSVLTSLGIIIGVSSVAGDRGRKSNYYYGSSKAAFSSYLSGIRNRLNLSNVTVLTVKPGFIKTKMTRELEFPNILSSSASNVAEKIFNAQQDKKNVIYVKWFWRYLMLVIKIIPERIFKKTSL